MRIEIFIPAQKLQNPYNPTLTTLQEARASRMSNVSLKNFTKTLHKLEGDSQRESPS